MKIKKKIIIITSNSSWNITNFRINLVKEFINNYLIVVVVPDENKYTEYLRKIGCKVYIIKYSRRGINLLDNLLVLFKYIFLFIKIKPDYIFPFTIKPNIFSSIASKFIKTKTINNITGLGNVFIEKNFIKKIIIILYKISFKNSSKIFFHNEDDLNYFLKKKIVNKNIGKVIPGSGINLNIFKYQKPLKKIDSNFVFLYLGRLITDKGILVLLDSVELIKEKYPNIKFKLVGELDSNDKNYNKIYDKIQNLDKRNLTYYSHTNDIMSFYREADCIILPSFREGLPRTLLEASSLGVPIITTDVPGCNRLIKDNYNGFLCKVSDKMDLCKKIIEFIELDYAIKLDFTKNARSKVENFYDERIIINEYKKSIYD